MYFRLPYQSLFVEMREQFCKTVTMKPPKEQTQRLGNSSSQNIFKNTSEIDDFYLQHKVYHNAWCKSQIWRFYNPQMFSC